MASGPQVTAVINVQDNASAAIQRLADIAANTSKQVNTHIDSIGKGRNYGNALNGMNLAFTAMAANALKHVAQVMSKLSELEARMQAFGGASQKQARDLTNTAITNGPQLPGGALGYAQSAKAGLQAGLTSEQAKLMAPHGMHYAKMNETSPEQGTEELLQLANMWGNFKNQKGESVSPDQLSAKEFEAGVAKTRARYIREARQLPGKPRDLFEFYKMAGPALQGAGVPEELQGAMAVKMAQGGIAGSHAGTYSRGIVERAITPTAGGRSSLAAIGIDINKLVHVNPNAIQPENAAKSVQAQVGKLDPKAFDSVRDTAEKLKRGEITYTEAVEQAAKAITGQQKKGGKGVIDDQAAMKIANGTMINYVDKVDFLGLMNELKSKEGGLPILRKLFGIESGTGAKVLLHSDLGETADRNKKEREAKPDREVIQEADTAMMNSIPAAYERLKNTIESLEAQVASQYGDKAIAVMNAISDFGQMVLAMNGPVKDLASDLAIVGAGFAAFKTTAKIGEIAAGLSSLGTAAKGATGPLESVAGSMGKLAGVNIAGLAGSLGLLAFAVFEAIKFMQGIPKGEENHNPRVQAWDRARNGIVKPGETYEDLIHSEKWRPNKRFASGNVMDNPTKGSTDTFLRSLQKENRELGVYDGGQAALKRFGWDVPPPKINGDWSDSINAGNVKPPSKLNSGWSDNVGNGGVKPAADGDGKTGQPGQTSTPQAVTSTVNGTVTGEATVKAEIVITPSPLFNSRMSAIESAVINLKGAMATGNKLGQTMLGGDNSTRPSAPATVNVGQQ